MTAGKQEGQAWRWLHDVVKKLGLDGMSSEESEGESEELQPSLKVKTMPWRRDISHELVIVDKQRKVNLGIFHNQGSKPMVR